MQLNEKHPEQHIEKPSDETLTKLNRPSPRGHTMGVTTALMLAMIGLQPADTAAPGQMTIINKDGTPGRLVPLDKTKVFADIGSIGARVTVIQTFRNSSPEPIEAVYTFPLPEDGAVDRMRMSIGNRIVEGEIKKRQEARAIYEAAKAQGQVTSLLEQQRTNIFTQNVANIMPGKEVQVEISYVHQLDFKDGEFEFNFPMVVGPRFLPESTPDPEKIVPAYMPPDTRSGSKIDIIVTINPGAKIQNIYSPLHKISTVRSENNGRASVKLARADEIPNKDFILRYRVPDAEVQETFLTNYDPQLGGVFCLNFIPPREIQPENAAPKEIIFVIDQSGSQSGFPIEKSKEVAIGLINNLHPQDFFNVVTFSNGANQMWPEPVPNTSQNRANAIAHLKSIEPNGGTYFLPAIEMAYGMRSSDPDRLRIVLFNTDAYVSNEFEILDLIQKKAGETRMFTFGIGNSVNRFLIDAMSAEGRGDSTVVTLAEDAQMVTDDFIERLENPLLTDIEVTIQGANQQSITPVKMPDLFGTKPVTLMGRYNRPGPATITVTGKMGGQPWSKSYNVTLGRKGNSGKALQSLWARKRVDDITRTAWLSQSQLEANLDPSARLEARIENAQDPKPSKTEIEITDLCLKYGIMSQYTSFVAVEKRIVNVGGKQRLINVPVEQADGVGSAVHGAEFDLSRARFSSMAMGGGGGADFSKLRGGAGLTPAGANSLGYDPSDNSIIFREATAESKISAKLAKAKGKVEVQIKLANLDQDLLDQLKKLGLKIEDQDKANKVVFGTIDAEKLKKLAEIKEVLAIDPL